jgi:hypothetical protein
MDELAEAVVHLLYEVRHPRFYETERGFQGRLNALVQERVSEQVLPADAIVEEEYQKRMARHGNRLRPDLIVHRPTPEDEDPTEGNHLVVAFKRRATASDAAADFDKLDRMIDDLGYPAALFVNIDSDATHSDAYSGAHTASIHCAATRLVGDDVRVVYERPDVAF